MPSLTRGDTRHAALRAALATALLLLVPLVAMRFTGEVRWTAVDFAAAGALLFGAFLAFLLVLRATPRAAPRLAFGMALAGGLALAWANLAVGVLGAPGNPANLMYAGVLGIGILGAFMGRFRARGMARATAAMALAMVLAGLVGVVFRPGAPSDPAGLILVSRGLFAALFLASAALFRRAAVKSGPDPG